MKLDIQSHWRTKQMSHSQVSLFLWFGMREFNLDYPYLLRTSFANHNNKYSQIMWLIRRKPSTCYEWIIYEVIKWRKNWKTLDIQQMFLVITALVTWLLVQNLPILMNKIRLLRLSSWRFCRFKIMRCYTHNGLNLMSITGAGKKADAFRKTINIWIINIQYWLTA